MSTSRKVAIGQESFLLPVLYVAAFEPSKEAEGKEKSMRVEAKLEKMGLVLPNPTKIPAGLVLPFSWVRVRAERAYVSGHVSLNPDGPRRPQEVAPFGEDVHGAEEERGRDVPDLRLQRPP